MFAAKAAPTVNKKTSVLSVTSVAKSLIGWKS